MKKYAMIVVLLIALMATACGGTATGDVEPAAAASQSQLRDNYDDALSVQGQLALGTIQLDETAQAVDETQAAELLPLWQALNTLSTSDTAASVEIDAVVKQIEETMTSAQVEAIAVMALTNASVTELQNSGALAFGGFGMNSENSDSSSSGFTGFPGGGFPGGGEGAPGGGAGPAGGGDFGGGMGGGMAGGMAGETMSEDDIATRQAQFAGDNMSDRMLLNAVIRLLQTKTGETPTNMRGNLFESVYTAVSEATGLTMEEIQAAAAEGQTLAQIIEANGGDVTAVRETIIATLDDASVPEGQDVGQLVDDMLNGSFANQPPSAPTE
ncbi:MAG: hypothetical protein R3E31_22080 [Chloroflexota bacterium]